MKKSLLIVSMLLFLISCSKFDHNYRGRPLYTNPLRPQEDSRLPEKPVQTHFYVSGVKYPDDYDWIKDELRGEVPCTLFLLDNGEPICEIPVSWTNETNADGRSHHIWQGHIYTDFTNSTETVIKKDGKVVMRLDSREIVHSIADYNGTIYSINEVLGKNVLRFRQGTEIIQDFAESEMQRGLYLNGEDICCLIKDTKTNALHDIINGIEYIIDNTKNEYYTTFAQIFDILHVEDKKYMIAKSTHDNKFKLYSNFENANLEWDITTPKPDFRLLYTDKNIYVICMDLISECKYKCVLKETQLFLNLSINGLCQDFVFGGGKAGFLQYNTEFGFIENLNWGGRIRLGEDINWVPECKMSVYDGNCYIPLIKVGETMRQPVIWDNKKGLSIFPFNGYLTNLIFDEVYE